MKTALKFAMVVSLVAVFSLPAFPQEKTSGKPNIVLIMADDMGRAAYS